MDTKGIQIMGKSNIRSTVDSLFYCDRCKKYVGTIIRKEKEQYPVLGNYIEIEADVTRCIECNEGIFNEKLDYINLAKAYAMYRQMYSLITPEEIEDICKRHSDEYSYEDISILCGFASDSIKRFIRGTLPSPLQNNILCFIRDDKNFKQLVKINSKRLKEYREGESKV